MGDPAVVVYGMFIISIDVVDGRVFSHPVNVDRQHVVYVIVSSDNLGPGVVIYEGAGSRIAGPTGIPFHFCIPASISNEQSLGSLIPIRRAWRTADDSTFGGGVRFNHRMPCEGLIEVVVVRLGMHVVDPHVTFRISVCVSVWLQRLTGPAESLTASSDVGPGEKLAAMRRAGNLVGDSCPGLRFEIPVRQDIADCRASGAANR